MLDSALEAGLHFAQDVPIDVLEEDLFAKLALRLGQSRNALMRMIGLFVSRGRRCLGRKCKPDQPDEVDREQHDGGGVEFPADIHGCRA